MKPEFGRQPIWIPNTNVFIADSGHLIIQVELSSMRSDDLEIILEGRRLRVAGHRRNSEFSTAKDILVQEIRSGPFESVLDLPPGFDLAHAKAVYLNGVLTIDVPKEDSGPNPA